MEMPKMVFKKETNFDSRFKLNITFEECDENHEVLSSKNIYTFFVNKPEMYVDKKVLEYYVESGTSLEIEEGIFANSSDLVTMSNEIRRIVYDYLKNLSMDFLTRHQHNYQSAKAPINSRYKFELIDLFAPFYEKGCLTDKTVEQTLITFFVDASDFVYNPNYQLSLLPIWGDFDKVIYDANNNRKTVPQKGIKSTIRYYMTRKPKDFINRFYRDTLSRNFQNINTIEVSR